MRPAQKRCARPRLGPVAPRWSQPPRTLADPLAILVHVGFHAIQFAEQDRRRVDRVTGVDEILGGADRQVVHHFQPGRDDAGTDQVGHRPPGAFHIVEAGQQDLRHRRARQQPDGDLHHHAEQPFGAGEQRQQVEAGAVQGAGPQAQALAFQGHDVHLQQVVHGQAVLQAMHAAGVLRDVAADGAGDLRGRVRCVVQTMRGSGLGDRQVAHARLDPGETTQRIDLEDPPETRHHQQHAVLQRQRAAGQAGAGTARHDRHLQPMAEGEQALNLFDAFRQCHQQRRAAIRRESVALVGTQVFRGVQQFEVGQAEAQLGQQAILVHLRQRTVQTLVVEDVHGGCPCCGCRRDQQASPACTARTPGSSRRLTGPTSITRSHGHEAHARKSLSFYSE